MAGARALDTGAPEVVQKRFQGRLNNHYKKKKKVALLWGSSIEECKIQKRFILVRSPVLQSYNLDSRPALESSPIFLYF